MWHSAIVMTSAESVKVANGGQPDNTVTLGVRASSALTTIRTGPFLIAT